MVHVVNLQAAEEVGVLFAVQTRFYDVGSFRSVVGFGHSAPPSFVKMVVGVCRRFRFAEQSRVWERHSPTRFYEGQNER